MRAPRGAGDPRGTGGSSDRPKFALARSRGGRESAARPRDAARSRRAIFDPIRRVVAFYEMPRRWARGAAAQSAHARRIAS